MMLWEQAKYLAEAKKTGFQARISAAAACPHLFTFQEQTRWNDELSSRGFLKSWAESRSYRDREAWDQLKNGVILLSTSMSWYHEDRRYGLGITKYPNEDEVWLLTYRGSVLARGTDHLSLFTELDSRKKFQRRA